MAKPNFWTDEEVAKLKRMWRAGRTAEEISKALPGRTRAAVLGILKRDGLFRTKRPRLYDISREPPPITLAGPEWSWVHTLPSNNLRLPRDPKRALADMEAVLTEKAHKEKGQGAA